MAHKLSKGSAVRRCYCRDDSGKPYGARCPQLSKKGHGTWQVQQGLHETVDGKRRRFRRSGFDTKDDASEILDQLWDLLKIPETQADKDALAEWLLKIASTQEKLPSVADVRRALKSGDTSGHKPTVGEHFDGWLPKQTHLRRSTYISYEGHINNYIKPKVGGILLERLSDDDLSQMFVDIAAESEAWARNNEDRMAIKAQIAAAPTSPRTIRRALRAELAALPPYRRPIGPAGRMSIKRTLRVGLEAAIPKRLISFNPAKYLKLVYAKPRVLVWTDARVAEWRRTGVKPSSVMVWTPAQAGEFLEFTKDDPFALFWRIKMFRGPRRGELCGLDWTEVDEENYRWMQITSQLTEVDYEVEESLPKTAAGFRIVALDEQSGLGLRAHRVAQNKARLEWGDAWIETGKVFTEANGAALRPSKMTDRFEALVAASGLPPIRLHDLRHMAAVLALAAGTDMKVIQDMLGHASLSVTSDLYATVLPELAITAAEASVELVDKARRRPFGHALATQIAEIGHQGR